MMRIRLLLLVLVLVLGFSCITAVSQAGAETSAWDRALANSRAITAATFDYGIQGRSWSDGRCSGGSQIVTLAAGCPAGFPIDCGNGRCCPSGTVCCGSGGCCPVETPLCCGNGKCCGAGKPHACPSKGKCFVTLNDAIEAGCSMQEVFVCGQPVR